MKKLKKLATVGEILTKIQMKKIVGGYSSGCPYCGQYPLQDNCIAYSQCSFGVSLCLYCETLDKWCCGHG